MGYERDPALDAARGHAPVVSRPFQRLRLGRVRVTPLQSVLLFHVCLAACLPVLRLSANRIEERKKKQLHV